LCVGSRVRYDDETRLFEGSGNVVGEVTGSEAACNCDGAGVSGKLEDGTLAIGTSRDDTDVGWIIDGNNDASCEDDFLPMGSMLERTAIF
jgi:hypothetical protein